MLAEALLQSKLGISRVVENPSCLYFEISIMPNNSDSIISRTIARGDFFSLFIIYPFSDNVRLCEFF